MGILNSLKWVGNPKSLKKQTNFLFTQGWIFWSDWGSTPYIAMAALDGSHMEKIAYNREDGKEYLGWPNGLTLDTSSTGDRLYWIDAKLDSIFTCLVKNCMQNIEVILHNTEDIKHPFSITVFKVKPLTDSHIV